MEQTQPSRFDYIKFDEISAAKQAKFKEAAKVVEAAIEALDLAICHMDALICTELSTGGDLFLPSNGELARRCLAEVIGDERSADDMLMNLEEAYLWTGKTLRDNQIARNGSAELQEGRNNA